MRHYTAYKYYLTYPLSSEFHVTLIFFYLYPRNPGTFTDHLQLYHYEIKMSISAKAQLKNTPQSCGMGLGVTEIVIVIYHKE